MLLFYIIQLKSSISNFQIAIKKILKDAGFILPSTKHLNKKGLIRQ